MGAPIASRTVAISVVPKKPWSNVGQGFSHLTSHPSGRLRRRLTPALAVKESNMARRSKAEFVKWFGPLLDTLRDLGDSGRPREVYDRIAKNLV